eukprot:2355952-Amphidinium_carterae.1
MGLNSPPAQETSCTSPLSRLLLHVQMLLGHTMFKDCTVVESTLKGTAQMSIDDLGGGPHCSRSLGQWRLKAHIVRDDIQRRWT